MVVGVLGEAVVHPVALEYRREHALILHQNMEDFSVLDLRVKLVIRLLAQVIILHFLLTFLKCGFEFSF